MRNLTVTKQIKVNFTAEQWDLYTHAKDCTVAASELNRALESSFNRGATRTEVYNDVYEVMKRNSSYGAGDSEPIYFVEDVLNELYLNTTERFRYA